MVLLSYSTLFSSMMAFCPLIKPSPEACAVRPSDSSTARDLSYVVSPLPFTLSLLTGESVPFSTSLPFSSVRVKLPASPSFFEEMKKRFVFESKFALNPALENCSAICSIVISYAMATTAVDFPLASFTIYLSG